MRRGRGGPRESRRRPAENEAPHDAEHLGLPSSSVRMRRATSCSTGSCGAPFSTWPCSRRNRATTGSIAAGVPWYVALFGRDSIITALETLAFAPEVGRATLELLAALPGTRDNPERDEEPGKILHELRVGERARLGEVPFTPYYGSVDATPLFLILLGEYLQWTGDLDCFTALRPQVDAALSWLEREGDPDGDGLFEYVSPSQRRSGQPGLEGLLQRHRRRETAPWPCRRSRWSRCRATPSARSGPWPTSAASAGDGDRATRLEQRAKQIQETFERSSGARSSATTRSRVHGEPGAKRVADVDASNQGQALWGGIVAGAHAVAVRDSVMDPDRLNAGWGVRTLSQAACGLQPVRLPDGGGLAARQRDGGRGPALATASTTRHSSSSPASTRRPPGSTSTASRSCSPASTGPPTAGPCGIRWPAAPRRGRQGACRICSRPILGLVPDAFARTLHIVRPRLPAWLDWVEIKGLTVGQATSTCSFERSGDLSLAAVTSKARDVQVMIEY